MTNKEQILKLIDLFTDSLQATRGLICASESQELFNFFQSAKDYRDSLTITNSGPLPKVYEIYCDMVDEAGGIATLATILASNQINLKNIGIVHSREFIEAVLRIEFYEQSSLDEAVTLLTSLHYSIYHRK